MRSWAVATIGVGLVVLLGGCDTLAADLDGQLTDDWTVLAEAKHPLPEVGDCHLTEARGGGTMVPYDLVECTDRHASETMHVGTVGGAAAQGTSPPAPDSADLSSVNVECDAKSRAYLGGDWIGAWLRLDVVLPTDAAWEGGARWFRCDVLETEQEDGFTTVLRTKPLKDSLKAASALQLGCFDFVEKGNDTGTLAPLACTAAHNSEFVGVYRVPGTTFHDDSTDAGADFYADGCDTLIAAFVKVAKSQLANSRVGVVWVAPTKEGWDAGTVRAAQCYLWVERKVTKSLRGVGAGGLP